MHSGTIAAGNTPIGGLIVQFALLRPNSDGSSNNP